VVAGGPALNKRKIGRAYPRPAGVLAASCAASRPPSCLRAATLAKCAPCPRRSHARSSLAAGRTGGAVKLWGLVGGTREEGRDPLNGGSTRHAGLSREPEPPLLSCSCTHDRPHPGCLLRTFSFRQLPAVSKAQTLCKNATSRGLVWAERRRCSALQRKRRKIMRGRRSVMNGIAVVVHNACREVSHRDSAEPPPTSSTSGLFCTSLSLYHSLSMPLALLICCVRGAIWTRLGSVLRGERAL